MCAAAILPDPNNHNSIFLPAWFINTCMSMCKSACAL